MSLIVFQFSIFGILCSLSAYYQSEYLNQFHYHNNLFLKVKSTNLKVNVGTNIKSGFPRGYMKTMKNVTVEVGYMHYLYYHLMKKSKSFPLEKSNTLKILNDNFLPLQWYLHDCRTCSNVSGIKNTDEIKRDINLIPVWYKYQLFGKGVNVIVVDYNADLKHSDLKYNYVPELSKDFTVKEIEEKPNYSSGSYFKKSSHGSMCAGIIAMQADNKKCGVGISPLVNIGGLKYKPAFNSGNVLSFQLEHADIMTNSWGPKDDGKIVGYLNSFTRASLKLGTKKGRKKNGILYVFAAGNGRERGDMCAYDAIINSIHTISVTSADHDGSISSYAEPCAAIIVTAYGGNADGKHSIVTTGKKNSCVLVVGTSAAGPMVAGILALVLEANPKISWRAVQHGLVWTSEVAALQHNPGWFRNAAGFYYNLNFGFGLINALKMVEFAKLIENSDVPPMSTCEIRLDGQDEVINKSTGLLWEIHISGCKGLPSEINYLEHVQVFVSHNYPRRGALEVTIQSPMGTASNLISPRRRDRSKMALINYGVDTVHMWGENPCGWWKVQALVKMGSPSFEGAFTLEKLVLQGTKTKPVHYKNKRPYYPFKIHNGLKNNKNNKFSQSLVSCLKV